MTTTLSQELAVELDRNGNRPLCVVDPSTQKHYVIVAAEQFDYLSQQAATAPSPSDWSEVKNARRCALIRQKYAGGLTPSETAELEHLQEQVGQFRELLRPLAADTVRALEAEMQRIQSESAGPGKSF